MPIPEVSHLNNLEHALSEQMLATMDKMEDAGIPDFLVTIDSGPKRIVVLSQPYLYTERQKSWEEISNTMKSELDYLHADPNMTTGLAYQNLQDQDIPIIN